MAFYDRISKQWHAITGHSGGAFKTHVLNNLLIQNLPDIQDQAILELGAGNGYFLPLALRQFSGQSPSRIVITDQSQRLLTIAHEHFQIANAEYQQLDVRSDYPFDDGAFDLILATMVFNEVTDGGLRRAFAECNRILTNHGMLLATVTHPEFVQNLAKRNLLRRDRNGVQSMPGADGLRLPVVRRSITVYVRIAEQSGLQVQSQDVFPSDKVLNAKPGLRKAGNVPLALFLRCTKL